MTVDRWIARAAHWYSNNTALIYEGRKWTFAEVNARVNQLANGLLGLGLQKGDRVALLFGNCHQSVEADFALARAGLVKVPLLTRLSAGEIGHILHDSECRAVICGPEFVDAVQQVRSTAGAIEHLIALCDGPSGLNAYEALLASASSDEPRVSLQEDDLHTLAYTSGTTGKPKGVMHSHATWLAVATNMLVDLGSITEQDVLLHVVPLTHGTGTFVLPYFVRGAANLILSKFEADQFCQAVEQHRVTVAKLVPTLLIRLLEYEGLYRHDLSSLHTIIYGASPMPAEKLRQAIDIFGPIFIQIYGQWEAPMTITHLSKKDHKEAVERGNLSRLAAAGRPFTRVEVSVVTDAGVDVEPGGEIGEVIVRGDHTMLGYWDQPEATAETLRNGWVYTGDLATVDEEGYIYLVDRRKDMVISGGLNIYPREIEEVIYAHPEVVEAAVIGVPDEEWGEAVKLIVAVRDRQAVSADDLIEFCRAKLAPFKRPRSVDFVDELPKNPSGKILKRVLRERYWVGYDRRIH